MVSEGKDNVFDVIGVRNKFYGWFYDWMYLCPHDKVVHKKSFSRKNKGFSHSDSVQLQADSKVLHSGRVERSAVKYRLEDQNT